MSDWEDKENVLGLCLGMGLRKILGFFKVYGGIEEFGFGLEDD